MSRELNNSELSLLEKFKAKASEFSMAFNSLQNIDRTKLTPEQRQEYDSLLNGGDRIYSTIQWITSTVDNVTGFFSDFFSFDGVAEVKNYINEPQRQLGVIPLIPIAAISGALAVMAKFVTDVYLFERKINEQEKLISQGIAPAEAAQIVKKIGGNSALETAKEIAKPIGIAISLWALYRIIQGFRA